jgi:hypothetical protein
VSTAFCNHGGPSRSRPKQRSSALFSSSGSDDDQQQQQQQQGVGELTSALARLDQQWAIQQRTKPQSRWTKLVLNKEGGKDDMIEEPPEVPTPLATRDFVYLLEPPNSSMPSCLIVFTGGAGLGTYPQVAYNEFLIRISNKLNAAVLTAPYNVGLDHFALAKETGELLRRAIIHCQDDPSRIYPPSLPTYSLSHSLGSKLACIYMAATNQEYDRVGLISFNNFSFGKTIGMVRDFAAEIRKSTGQQQRDAYTAGATSDLLNTVFDFAETAVSAIGIEYSPPPDAMERLIQMKYNEDRQAKTRLFTFDDDNLENTQDFVRACVGDGPFVSGLPGTHLTPVYFKLGLDEIAADIPDEAKEAAREAMGGFQSASFGNEEELNALVEEVCDWIKGKGPSRSPAWMRDRPRIAASPNNENS